MTGPVEKKDSRKVFVLGLDGGSFRALDPLVDAGVMTNLAGILRNGSRRILQSTIPPVTGPAWTTFMTGVNPATHGIFDFVRRVPGQMKRQIVAHGQIDAPTLFQMIERHGMKVGAVNLPLTYPPPSVNGFVVSGMLTPSLESEYTYPPDLKQEINQAVGPYILDVWWKRYSEQTAVDFVRELIRCLKQRTRTVRFLMKNNEWRFLTAVLTEVDRIHHSLWKYIEPDRSESRSRRHERIRGSVIEFYRELDQCIGEIVGELPPKTNFLIMSDHGFGPMRKKFFINSWLNAQGFLAANTRKLHGMRRRKKMLQGSRRILDALGLRSIASKAKGVVRKNEPRRMAPYDALDCIDWSKTVCYAASYSEQGLYINLKGREPYGTVTPGAEYEEQREKIMEKLGTLRDPEDNRQLKVETFRKEEIYSGPHLDEAPDIVFSIEDGAYLADIGLEKEVLMRSTWQTGSGTHRPEGIFIANGPDIKAGARLSDARMIDLAPTILHLLGLPVPENLEGGVLTDLLEGEMANAPVSYCQPLARSTATPDTAYSDEEESMVRDKLSGLGYMD